MGNSPTALARTVVLRHELPDGSWHYDWMLESQPASESLITFRTTTRPDSDPGQFHAERIQDHRAAYLTYEGPVSADRGSVKRELTGVCRVLTQSPDRFTIEVDWPTSRFSYSLSRSGELWLVRSSRCAAP